MIEVRERLRVSANKFFNQIIESVCYDIEKSTGKKLGASNLKSGYKYKKTMKNKLGRKGSVEVVICDFKIPISYSAKFKSVNGINKISYKIDKINDDEIDVIYKEEFEGNSKSVDVNFKFVGFFYKRSAKKRARKMLKSLESYLLQNSDNEN